MLVRHDELHRAIRRTHHFQRAFAYALVLIHGATGWVIFTEQDPAPWAVGVWLVAALVSVHTSARMLGRVEAAVRAATDLARSCVHRYACELCGAEVRLPSDEQAPACPRCNGLLTYVGEVEGARP